jgi:hypothetical protein
MKKEKKEGRKSGATKIPREQGYSQHARLENFTSACHKKASPLKRFQHRWLLNLEFVCRCLSPSPSLIAKEEPPQ